MSDSSLQPVLFQAITLNSYGVEGNNLLARKLGTPGTPLDHAGDLIFFDKLNQGCGSSNSSSSSSFFSSSFFFKCSGIFCLYGLSSSSSITFATFGKLMICCSVKYLRYNNS